MKPIIRVVLSLVALLMLSACDYSPEPYQVISINFKNQTDNPDYVIESNGSQVDLKQFMALGYYQTAIVWGNETNTWLSLCIGETSHNDTKELHLILFKQETLNRYTADELVEQNIYDKRYDLTYDELVAMNFTITYTGD